MKISIFFKTFLTLLFSFSVLFLLSSLYFYHQFSDKYVEENIEAVKNAIIESAPDLESEIDLANTALADASSETTFIRYKGGLLLETIGPSTLQESDLLDFVIALYDSNDLITEGNLSYTISLDDDIYNVSYIYRFGSSDYLLILTRIQSLRNIDLVLNDITMTQAIFLFLTITLLSLLISQNISKPVRRINQYAKAIARLDFSKELKLKRKDEFKEVISSLNEMTFNLQKTYHELDELNKRLSQDIEFEKQTEAKKKALIMTINHEIKTPISVIKGMVEGMIDEVGRYKDKKKYLNEVIKEIDKIDSIAKDLTYSLKLEDIAKPNDMSNIKSLEQSLKTVKEFSELKGVKLSLQLIDINIGINEELLGILITNLLKNAVNYSKDKKVSLTSKTIENKVVLEIRNKGQIKDKDLEKIFEPYYRIDISKEGTGLGLFIVKQICEIYDLEYKIFNDNGEVVSKVVFIKI